MDHQLLLDFHKACAWECPEDRGQLQWRPHGLPSRPKVLSRLHSRQADDTLDEVSLEVLARLKMLQQASVSASIPEVEQTSHQQDRAGRGCCSAQGWRGPRRAR